jgi:hypothetical protein
MGTYPWLRLGAQYPSYKILGSAGFNDDIAQGALGDCYFLAGISAVAEHPDIITNSIVIKNVSDAGIFSFNLWVRGIPTVVTIDDWVPSVRYYSNVDLLFAKAGWDGSLWGPLMEKAYAKINGNYE